MANDSQAALLLDFENLVIPFEGKDQAGALDVETLVDFVEDNFGNVIFRRAYADWSHGSFGRYQGQLQDLGVEMIQVRRRTRRSKKNGADILLTADAVECLLLRPFIDTFAIVSGDSDIGPLITKLKSHGKTVIVIGPDKKSTARHVISLADRFKFYTDIMSPDPITEKKGRGPRTPQEAVLSLLRRAGAPVESASLKRRLTAISKFRGFHEKALGFKTWTSFLESIPGVAIHRQSDLRVDVGLEKPGAS